MHNLTHSFFSQFLSTPSARRATEADIVSRYKHSDFYPRPPRGGRRLALPCFVFVVGISIHALREEGDYQQGLERFWSRISIHALREEGDIGFLALRRQLLISIHALREEGDFLLRRLFFLLRYFYPRPPRGGRPFANGGASTPGDFYPRPPRGGRQQLQNA